MHIIEFKGGRIFGHVTRPESVQVVTKGTYGKLIIGTLYES
jgi:hypothetical protein